MFDSNSSLYLTPQPFPVSGVPYIAPYWFDNDIFVNRSGDIESTVYYREIERGRKIITRASREIRRAFPNAKKFHPSALLIITWNIHNPRRNQSNMVINIVAPSNIISMSVYIFYQGNQFQCVLASEGNLSFVIFHYADGFLQQATSDKGSEYEYAVNVKGQAGINGGDDCFEMIEVGAGLSETTNVGIPGVWMYQINERTANKPSKITL